jgi:hypothetical protein
LYHGDLIWPKHEMAFSAETLFSWGLYQWLRILRTIEGLKSQLLNNQLHILVIESSASLSFGSISLIFCSI